MNHGKRPVDKEHVERTTDLNKHYAEQRMLGTISYLRDPDRKERLNKAFECKWCFYFNRQRIGGAAMSERPCGICEAPVHSGNTNVGTVCDECAKKYELCSYCGADIELRARRRVTIPAPNWTD